MELNQPLLDDKGNGIRKKRGKKKCSIETYLYLIPALTIFFLFTYLPFFRTIYRSFFLTDNRGIERVFVGFQNYTDLLTSSSFQNSLIVTFQYVAIVLILGMGFGFLTALLCNRTFPGIRLFSTVYAMPMAVASSGIAMVFSILLNQRIGALNQILGTNISWLADPRWALISVAVLTGWLNSGINFLYFSAGLSNVDESLYESASVDCANTWNQFLYITLPGLKHISFYILVINVISAFQSFGQIRILTSGGPGESTNVIVHDIYRNAFVNFRFGLASAESVILFIIVGILTVFMFRTQRKEN
ncbi:carbohydrate ABC transporter permease [Alkalibacterium thalassium]|uniref:sn-glycerol 3-phosphate transport system permease protein n=1 Tax=Alkalibacterium thalassium TaxID=426701 RepID=A0A1G8WN09_9LACT|nr:sugar ABC transporter permease [Alkalibacterium thalassium]SDJ79684.1 sn-glycerol 3-phosphate transport system permease protein [Alkalibacterium thalassium]